MKLCGMSDMHGTLIDVPQCDVLCLCGDITELNVQRNVPECLLWWLDTFANWAKKQPCEKIIFVPGNHDIVIEKLIEGENIGIEAFKERLYKATDNKVVILIDELYEYKGVTFYGTPWIAPIHWQTWAFEDTQKHYDEETEYICPFEKIPKCDILISHENPNHNEKLEHCCFGKYKHHLFGHWHDGISYGHLNQHNCAILNDSYRLRNPLRIVTIDSDDFIDAIDNRLIDRSILISDTDEIDDEIE